MIARALTTALTASAAAALLIGASTASAQRPGPAVDAHSFAPGAERNWSRAQMIAAQPVPAETATPVEPALPAPRGATAPATLSGTGVANPSRPENRVHGRLFFSAGGSDFTCSATVISSGRGNLINTAGHCVYDHATGGFVSSVVFVPGYRNGKTPFGIWRATHAVTPGQWTSLAAIDYDLAMLRIDKRDGETLQEAVGSRGIGFGQPAKGKKLRAFGYPASPASKYDGEDLIRCGSRAFRDPAHRRSIGINCDMGFGASGGGWVAQDAIVVASTSHGHGQDASRIYGPRFRSAARKLYTFSGPDYPSVGPVRCAGKVATIVGTDRGERLVGSKKDDVIATLGGDDVVRSKGGRDLICTADGDDRIDAGPGRDRILAGRDADRCDGGLDRDRATGCERSRRVP